MYEIDNCFTDAHTHTSAGFDVVVEIDGDPARLHRLGTYSSPRVALLTAEEIEGARVIQTF